MTLAYVFWHAPRCDADISEYQERTAAFHRALTAARPAGFHGSLVYRVESGVPWLIADTATYEDWYLVEDSAALDTLNTAAVSGPRATPHDRAAVLSAAGTAGLYGLRFGTPRFPVSLTAVWISKPGGQPYDEFYRHLRAQGGEGAALWGRQMVLGPTPEFCLHTSTGEAPPLEGAVVTEARLLWRDGA